MPAELPHACHNCSGLGYLFAEGAHAWCKRHQQTISMPESGCAYWSRAKNAELIKVPVREFLTSADYEREREKPGSGIAPK
jgi:hypothetical protein